LAISNMDAHREYVTAMRNHFIEQLEKNFEDIQFNGDYLGRAHFKVVSVSFPPSPKSELMLLNLDICGISASGGSACSSGAEVRSHVLNGIGAAAGRKSIRFSFSHYNKMEEVDYVIEKLKHIIPVRQTVV